jgi:hypothetical protein
MAMLIHLRLKFDIANANQVCAGENEKIVDESTAILVNPLMCSDGTAAAREFNGDVAAKVRGRALVKIWP